MRLNVLLTMQYTNTYTNTYKHVVNVTIVTCNKYVHTYNSSRNLQCITTI